MRAALAAVGAAAALATTGAAEAAPAMWVVRDADSEIFLFGTMHALKPGADWRTPAYEAAYQKAEAVWFEAVVDPIEPGVISGLVERYGVDRERPLSSRLSPRQLKDLEAVLAEGELTVAKIDHLRPWAAALVLSMQPVRGGGASVEAGADMVVTRQARQAQKPIRAFETMEDQVRMFAGLPPEVELQYLVDVIAERRGKGVRKGSHADAWIRGDVGRLGKGVVGAMQSDMPQFYDALLKRRNHAWAEALSDQMAGEGVQLVNVGALHLLGDDGLPALMKARGYQVERIQ
ncbi:TraB/GumN family protein [Phenylobacterium terrae]|uniref:TraB/GumN family protein n=1 Tax=Phenylobacterium terrae TaxID=2665495 RepID=A0ABW4MXP2_9CAUL